MNLKRIHRCRVFQKWDCYLRAHRRGHEQLTMKFLQYLAWSMDAMRTLLTARSTIGEIRRMRCTLDLWRSQLVATSNASASSAAGFIYYENLMKSKEAVGNILMDNRRRRKPQPKPLCSGSFLSTYQSLDKGSITRHLYREI